MEFFFAIYKKNFDRSGWSAKFFSFPNISEFHRKIADGWTDEIICSFSAKNILFKLTSNGCVFETAKANPIKSILSLKQQNCSY